MKSINIIVADTSYLTRKGLQALFVEKKGFCLLGEAENFSDLIKMSALKNASVLITDLLCPEFNLENISLVTQKHPNIRVLCISSNVNKVFFTKAGGAGVKGLLLKDCDENEIVEAIQKTSLGEKFVCGKILDVVLNEPKESPIFAQVASCNGVNITDREAEIIRLVAEGNSNKQIADKLFLSTHTVTTHRKNIMGKLSVNNTAGLVLYALKNNLLGHNKFLFSSEV